MTTKVIDYRIIKGTSEGVEELVKALLNDGWTLNGELLPMKVDRYNIVAQGMILYADDEGEKQ